MRSSLLLAPLLSLLALLAGCGLFSGKEDDETAGWSAQRLYGEAKDAMTGKEWARAIKYFEKLEARFPYGRFAQQAQLEVAYCHFKDGERASAIAAADRFIKLYPNHPNVDYAYYLKGLINFNDMACWRPKVFRRWAISTSTPPPARRGIASKPVAGSRNPLAS